MMINGVDFNSRTRFPKTRFKQFVAPPYLMLGRFDTDDSSTWLSPAEVEAIVNDPSQFHLPISWEMSHFAFTEMTYLGHYMTPREYSRMFDFLGNSLIALNSDRSWFGLRLLDPTTDDLLLATQLGIPRQAGAVSLTDNEAAFVLEYDERLRAVNLGGETILRYGPLDPNKCPQTLNKCTEVRLQAQSLESMAWLH